MVKLEDVKILAKNKEPDNLLVTLYKYIYLFLGHSFDNISNNDIINNFITNIFPKYKLESISK